MTFLTDGKEIVAGAGTFVNMPPGVPHAFRNNSDRVARMIISVVPAGLEQMFFEVGTPLAEGATDVAPPTKEEIDRLVGAAARYGIEILPPSV